MTGILAKQLFLHPWAPERAVNVQVRVHGLWLSEAVQRTSSALRLLEGQGTSMKDVHAWGPASWTVVNSQPILPPVSDPKVNTLELLCWDHSHAWWESCKINPKHARPDVTYSWHSWWEAQYSIHNGQSEELSNGTLTSYTGFTLRKTPGVTMYL